MDEEDDDDDDDDGCRLMQMANSLTW